MSKNTTTTGIGVLGVLQIVLIVLKLLSLIDWSWWLVFIPLWIELGLTAFALLMCFIVAVLLGK